MNEQCLCAASNGPKNPSLKCPSWNPVGREDKEDLVKRGYALADRIEEGWLGENIKDAAEIVRRLCSRVENL